jgi:hypothetical protein
MTYEIGRYVCDNCGKAEPGDCCNYPGPGRGTGDAYFRALPDGRDVCSRACGKALDPTWWDQGSEDPPPT